MAEVLKQKYVCEGSGIKHCFLKPWSKPRKKILGISFSSSLYNTEKIFPSVSLLAFTVKQIFFVLTFKIVSKARAYGQKNIIAVLPFFLAKNPRIINRK